VSRSDRRISRPLIAVLGVTVCLGAASIIYKLNHGAAKTGQSAAHPALVVERYSIIAPADNSTPATRPAPESENDKAPPAIQTLVPTPPAGNDVNNTSNLAKGSDDSGISGHAVLSSETSTPTTLPSSTVMSMAKSQIDAGKLLEARAPLNDALQVTRDPAQASQFKTMISQINQTLVFAKQRIADDPYSGSYVVQRGDTFLKIGKQFETTAELLERINGISAKSLRAGATIKVVQGPFFAVVDKKTFTMDIYLGGLPSEKSSMYVTSYKVGLGQDDSTPVGTWMIEPKDKIRNPTYYSPRGQGVIPAGDPKNPLAGYWIGLTGTGGEAVGKMSYGIHGTIEPDSIGKQSSMGCIRLGAADIPVVYDMLVGGKSVVEVK
jgi:lipoprotein-anchoring transpeptidase ErfK/SrfK